MQQRNTKKGAIIAIVGASGVGKSYLAKKLAKVVGASFLLEPSITQLPPELRNGFLTQDPQKILLIHLWFRNRQVQSICKALKLKAQGKIAILDTSLKMNQMYAQVYLKDTGKRIMEELLALDAELLAEPDVVIFLKASQSFWKTKRKHRGRAYEKSKENSRGVRRMETLLKRQFGKAKNTLVIHRDTYDFQRSQDVQKVIAKIRLKKHFTFKSHI